MEKKSKKTIIIGITTLLLVTLILIGLTYAYYRTRIIGNDADTSISVTSKVLQLTYADGSANIDVSGIEPSDTIYSKTFTVTNDGDDTLTYGVYLIDVVNTFERKDDIKYTLTCESGCNGASNVTFPSGISQMVTNEIDSKETQTYTLTFTYLNSEEDQSEDMGKTLNAKIQIFVPDEEGTYIPFEEGTLAYNIVNNANNQTNGTSLTATALSKFGEFDDTQLVTKYENNLKDLMTGSAEGASIYYTATPGDWENTIVPYGDYTQSNCEGRIGSYIVNVGAFSDNLQSMTPFEITGCEQIGDEYYPIIKINNPLYINNEKIVTTIEDNYGTSYYYRGAVTDNYADFAGMCWRIVRIQGNGAIKLILENSNNTCANATGYTSVGSGFFGYYTSAEGYAYFDYLNGDMANSFKNFQTNKLNNYLTYLNTGWEWNDKMVVLDTTYYDSFYRLSGQSGEVNPLLTKRSDTIYTEYNDGTTMYVGALTADEMILAGANNGTITDATQANYYLIDSGFYNFYSMSPAVRPPQDHIYVLTNTGLYVNNVAQQYLDSSPLTYRPVIIINNGVESIGNGTKSNPYVIS